MEGNNMPIINTLTTRHPSKQRHNNMSVIIVVFIISAISSGWVHADNTPIHIVSLAENVSIPLTRHQIWERIEHAAEEYQTHAPIPRIAFFDITYPRSLQEYKELGGYGLLLVTALSQEKDELPVKRTYFTGEKEQYDFPLILSLVTQIPKDKDKVMKTFGMYRSDTLYLFPMHHRAIEGQLSIDFSKNRTGFVLQDFPVAEDEFPMTPPTMEYPPDEVLLGLIKRELPMFFDIMKNKIE
jgi:hypothetical protein